MRGHESSGEVIKVRMWVWLMGAWLAFTCCTAINPNVNYSTIPGSYIRLYQVSTVHVHVCTCNIHVLIMVFLKSPFIVGIIIGSSLHCTKSRTWNSSLYMYMYIHVCTVPSASE